MRLIDADKLRHETSIWLDGTCLVMAVKDLDDAPTVDAAPQWISVKERLPWHEGRVLVALDEKGTELCHGLDTDRIDEHGKWVRWNGYVTHWMPLPEAPKENADAEE